MATQHDEFERSVVPQSRSLLRVAQRLTSDAAEAEDLVQETLLLAWRNFDRFRQSTNARAWLFRILFNSFYSQQRRKRTGPSVVPVESAEVIPCACGHSVVENMDVARALLALPLDQRTVLMLGVVEGFTCREMAEILSLPVGTVMSRISRARDALRAQFVPAAKYSGKEAS